MFNNKKILALIPARGGSKGIKDKNIIDINGKPLIAYSIEAGKKSRYVDSEVVTTDSEKIAKIARQNGGEVPFLRPAEYAQDKSKTIDAVLHAIRELKRQGKEYDTLVLLQPTQPLRTSEDIDKALELFFEKNCLPLVSVSEVDDHPLLIRTIDFDGILKPLLSQSSTCRRQDMPPFYRVNGCIYINKIEEIDENTSFNDNKLGFIMERSHSVDIDEYKDIVEAEYYLSKR